MKKRNKFSLSHYKLATMDMGELIPVSWFEALPGDTIQMQTSAFIRVGPTLTPVMTPCHVSFMTFSIPLRILCDEGPTKSFESFITGGADGLDTTVLPYYTIKKGYTLPIGSIGDYLGIPAGTPYDADVNISALPIRAYYRIWNEYFRDQDLQQPTAVGQVQTTGFIADSDSADNGGFQVVRLEPRRVTWKKDYFTIARPFEQKGPAVMVPIEGIPSGTISITGAPGATGSTSIGDNNSALTSAVLYGKSNGVSFNQSSSQAGLEFTTGTLAATFTGTSQLGEVSVDEIRKGFALQRFEEARALFGSRYVEYLRYLGVKSSDARLQRPEYLGGGSQVIQWSEVVQTGQGSDPVGTLRGHGVSGGRTRRFRRFFEEHCIVMTVAFIRPIALYTQSLSKSWSREVKEDFWQKELQHIGQEAILNKEIYAFGAEPDGVFGYMDKYDEYRSVPSTVSGDFRDTLDYWHLGRVFTSQPVLNSSFVSCNPSKRIFSEQTADEFYCMFLHSVQARRLVSKHGRPGGL